MKKIIGISALIRNTKLGLNNNENPNHNVKQNNNNKLNNNLNNYLKSDSHIWP